MPLGNFKETSESDETIEATETNEAKDATDDKETSRNQILDTPDDYDDDFENKLDDCEADQDSPEQDSTDRADSDSEKDKGEEKLSLLDKMRNLFSRKENSETNASKSEENVEELESKEPSQREKFLDSVRVDDYHAPDLDNVRNDSAENTDDASESDDSRGIEHGEDGERTQWSDAQYAREHNMDSR